jgi:hypothetical protein
VNVTIDLGRGVVRRRVRRCEHVVDTCQPIGHHGQVLDAYQRIQSPGGQIGRRTGPAPGGCTFTGSEALDRPAYRGRRLDERRKITFTEATFESKHRARELRFAGKSCRPLQRVNGAPRSLQRSFVLGTDPGRGR